MSHNVLWFKGDYALWRSLMRLQIVESKHAKSLYIVKSIYEKGKHSSKVVEKLGTYAELLERLNGEDPIAWGKRYAAELTRKEKDEGLDVLIKYAPNQALVKDEVHTYNGGYLFLQKIYHELGLDTICADIQSKYKFDFDLDAILSRLIYSRILYPSSKRSTFELSKRFMEDPKFELHHIYRALEVLAKESDVIQSSLYTNSLKLSNRNTGILYYDCTNYFFEIEEASGDKQYGVGKDHKPNPIVQMGLFMDGDGIPLAFSMHPGNLNEQLTLKPLEKRIIADFKLAKFVVCTDAGLSSLENRKFNDLQQRAFVTTQSIKKLKDHLKEWALDPTGWKCSGSSQIYDLRTLDESDVSYYKERWMNENGLEQKLIVTYSIKYREYQRTVRGRQIERAQVSLTQTAKLTKTNPNDYKRFIQTVNTTSEGEVAAQTHHQLNVSKIDQEARYDGFYAVCTNLEDDATQIIAINHRRWEIEECFRIMKSEFKARPVYLSKDDRIEAHFTTCFLSLILFRYLEKRLNNQYTCRTIINGLKDMNFYKVRGEGYIPTYTRTNFTDSLHEAFNFRTDTQFLTQKNFNKIKKSTQR